jgi:undecaprenyl diphosphate synthase
VVVLPVSRPQNIPVHVAVIMDANGRWAEARGLSRVDGHEAGTENIREIIRLFGKRGVDYLTLFAFSTENWRRPPREVHGLMRILSRVIDREVQPLHEAGVRLRYIGRLDVLDPALRRQIKRAVERTRHNDKMTVCIAFNYGGRSEVVDAVRRIVADGVAPSDVDEDLVARYLYTDGLPDPDLIIRTGGHQRLSNFMIWQAAYAEYYFTQTFWPDFSEADIDAALAAYGERVRKFGGLANPAAAAAAGTSGNDGDNAAGPNGYVS